MPIYSSGKCVCEHCNQEFDWVEYKKESNMLREHKMKFEKIPKGAWVKEFISPEGIRKFQVDCTHCAHKNEFPAPTPIEEFMR